MDLVTENSIQWVVAVQSLGTWLEMPMLFFSFLGSEDFFFIVLPLVYWSVDARVGLQIAFILAIGNFINPTLKLAFAQPRPYWVSEQVKAFAAETSFGIPSAHAQNSAAIWIVIAIGLRKRWAWIAAASLIFLIGFSRLYLGVHFVLDVLTGWLIGGLLVWAFFKFWDPAVSWLSRKSFGGQISIAFLISLAMIVVGVFSVARLDGFVIPQEWVDNALRAGEAPDPVEFEGFLTTAGSFFGLAAGAAWIASRGGYRASGPLEKRALRYLVGLIGILVLWMGLGAVFPSDENLISYVLRYVRYTLVGFWVIAGAPWLFFHFKLADPPKM